MTLLTTLSAPAGRFLLASIFLISGVNKIFAYEGTQGYMDAMGVPGGLLPVVIIFEIAASLAIILGWQTKIAAFALAGFSIVSAVIFHADFSNQMQMIMFMKNLALAGAFLTLVAQGAGAYSLDNRSAQA